MRENKKTIFFSDSMNSDMELMEKNRKALSTGSNAYDPAAWLEFATQFNAYMGHPLRPFTPITGRNFKL